MNANNNCARFPCPHANAPSIKIKLCVSAVLIGLTGLTAGCTTPFFEHAQVTPLAAFRVIKVTAVGYGASRENGYTPGQRRLMAMRASKLDAYRALAEQVQGVRVNGNSTVAAMMAQVDSFRVYVDAYLRGVQVVTVTQMEDGNFETTVELTLDDQFFGTFAQPGKMVVMPVAVSSANTRGAGGTGFAHGSNFYYSE